ncbi:MAG: copper transporter [Candidatus Saccharibacteria bacterium]
MIDIRYHVATLVAIFLALGIGIIIGSTVVGSNVLADQQQKLIGQLESQFGDLRERMDTLNNENRFVVQIARYYEQYSQAVSPPIIKNRLPGGTVALIVTGGQEIPAGMLSSLSQAGARVTSTTTVLPAIDLANQELKIKMCDFYKVDHNTPAEELRKLAAVTLAETLLKGGTEQARFLRDNDLVSFNGQYGSPVRAIIIVGGSDNDRFNYPAEVDESIIQTFISAKQKVYGCEITKVKYSYMNYFQKYDISTVDDIDMTPGQVALIRSIEGEVGDYGVKSTASKFMPSLPADFLGGPTQ